MKSAVMDVARRFTTVSAQNKVEEYLQRDDLEGSIDYLYGLFVRAWDEDEDEELSEEEKKAVTKHLSEFKKELDTLSKVE
ncbi:MAG: hypothetical protein JWO84_788 [Parcubacteria group bacterium]|nr:hypothetical protein [Parcubacteria group bacterium]